jgi:flagellum-specific peptidoglycan hydrolase FlgJ
MLPVTTKEGYATDPTYPQKLITLIKENNK